MSSSLLHPRNPVLPAIAGIIGCVPMLIGARVLARPAFMLEVFGFPGPAIPADTPLFDAVARIYAARNVALSLTYLAVWWRGDRVMMGIVGFAASILAIVDAAVSWQLVGGNVWRHLGFVPVTWAIAAALCGWLG